MNIKKNKIWRYS